MERGSGKWMKPLAALGRYSWMDPDAKTGAGLLLGPGKYRMLQ